MFTTDSKVGYSAPNKESRLTNSGQFCLYVDSRIIYAQVDSDVLQPFLVAHKKIN